MPKTYNELWDKVVDWENLHQAYLGASKGKRFQKDVLTFNSNLEENLINIQNHLIWRSWVPGQFRSFMVYEPKQRYIQAPPFKDRVVHHALVQVIEPLFEKKFIHHSYACRVGKGNHSSVLQLQNYLRNAKAKWNKTYVLKADISKYFPSIKHDVLVRILKRTIRDKDVFRVMRIYNQTLWRRWPGHTGWSVDISIVRQCLFRSAGSFFKGQPWC